MSACGPDLKAPFPWFGGKSAVADAVWKRFGTVKKYVEPFFGSGAVLLKRPDWRPGVRLVETVNDADGLLANFWRALQHDPAGVAAAADWPVNEACLHARHLWLVGQREALTDRLMGDPEWYDVRAAGWWVWGASCWIGSGWGEGGGSKLPSLSPAGARGINRAAGVGQLYDVAARLRFVGVACGDWSRVCTPSIVWTNGDALGAAVFLDPPYDEGVGYTGGGGVSAAVWAWACEQGGNPLLRIAVCGYEDGRDVPPGWRVVEWDANQRQRGGGYGNQGEDGQGRANARRERVWFSPACIPCEGDIDCATGEPVRVAGQQIGLGL